MKMPTVESEKWTVYIDRARSRRLNRYARTQKSSKSFTFYGCSNSCFLSETFIAGHLRLYSPNESHYPKNKCQDSRFSTSLSDMKSCPVDRGCMSAPKNAANWQCSFVSFVSFIWHFTEKQLTELIFRSSSGLFSVKIRKTVLGSNDLSMLPLKQGLNWAKFTNATAHWSASLNYRHATKRLVI